MYLLFDPFRVWKSNRAGSSQPVDEQGNTLLHLAVQYAGRAEVALLAKNRGLCSTKNSAGDLPVRTLPGMQILKLNTGFSSANASANCYSALHGIS